MGARVIEGEVPVSLAMERFDADGRLSDEDLEAQVREVAVTLLAEAQAEQALEL
jgi:hypothetical protein